MLSMSKKRVVKVRRLGGDGLALAHRWLVLQAFDEPLKKAAAESAA